MTIYSDADRNLSRTEGGRPFARMVLLDGGKARLIFPPNSVLSGDEYNERPRSYSATLALAGDIARSAYTDDQLGLYGPGIEAP